MNRRSKLAVQESKDVCSQLKKDVIDIFELATSLAEDFKVLRKTDDQCFLLGSTVLLGNWNRIRKQSGRDRTQRVRTRPIRVRG